MVSLLNDFVCVLLSVYYFDNICHILCTCIYQCEHSYADTDQSEMRNVSHTDYMNTRFLQCVFLCVQSCDLSL